MLPLVHCAILSSIPRELKFGWFTPRSFSGLKSSWSRFMQSQSTYILMSHPVLPGLLAFEVCISACMHLHGESSPALQHACDCYCLWSWLRALQAHRDCSEPGDGLQHIHCIWFIAGKGRQRFDRIATSREWHKSWHLLRSSKQGMTSARGRHRGFNCCNRPGERRRGGWIWD